jgi:hypothetical protein
LLTADLNALNAALAYRQQPSRVNVSDSTLPDD